MNRKRVIYIGILFIITVIVTITTFSYAFLTKVEEQHGKLNMVVGNLTYKIESNDLTNNSITLSQGESTEIELTIKAENEIDTKYELYTNDVEDVIIGYLVEEGFNESTGTISKNGTKKIKIVLENNSDTSKTITFGVQGGFEHNTITLADNRESIPEGQGLCTSGIAYEFDYTGNIQEFIARCPGLYKLEVWGAQGGNYTDGTGSQGGKGGYSTGNYTSDGNDKFYVVVGGQGDSPILDSTTPAAGGYNGGGTGANILDYSNYNWRIGGAGGGGATHISKSNTLLKDTETSNLIIVAGAGGGAGANSGSSAKQYNNGGAGGGSTGTNGSGSMLANYSSIHPGLGGSQTGAGCPQSLNTKCGGKGYGGSNGTIGSANQAGGGGAGYYGGGSGQNYGASGGGGSGYLGGVANGQTIGGNQTITEPNGTTATGHTGNGYARITYLGIPECEPGYTTNFDYTGNVQEFTTKCDGIYKLETWGAQGGNASNTSNYNGQNGSSAQGGYGAYSVGTTTLTKDTTLYVVVGGKGTNSGNSTYTTTTGGYNGGGNGGGNVSGSDYAGCKSGAAGGGATHIASVSGELKNLSNNINNIYIVSGAGGGALNHNFEDSAGGNGGGITGNKGKFLSSSTCNSSRTLTAAGGQSTGFAFGLGGSGRQGANVSCAQSGAGGAGGGFYGGIAQTANIDSQSGTGGSGYIGNPALTNKKMVCYNCTTSTDTATYTESNTCVNVTATTDCSKTENGYARITYLGK